MINEIIHPTHLWKKMKHGAPIPLMLTIVFFNITKIKQNGKAKTRTVSEVSGLSNKSDFYLGERQS